MDDENLDIKTTVDRLVANSTVKELILFDTNGHILQSTIDTTRAQNYRDIFNTFSYEARKTIKSMDPTDELTIIRMRIKGTEIIIAPEDHGTLALMQSVAPYDPPYRPPKKDKGIGVFTGGGPSNVNAPQQQSEKEENAEEFIKEVTD